MPLVTNDLPKAPSPWRAVSFAFIASVLFIVMLGPIAYCTRDDAGPVPEELKRARDAGPHIVDAGVRVVVDAGNDSDVDAGTADGGEVFTAEPEERVFYDGGDIGAQGPPLDARAVALVAVPVVEACLKQALRFDPSIGGKVSARIVVDAGVVQLTLESSPSPVLSRCVTTQGAALTIDGAPVERHIVDAQLVLDGLRQTVKLEDAALR